MKKTVIKMNGMDLVFYPFEEMLKKELHSKTFRDVYYRELARLDLVRKIRELRRSNKLSMKEFAVKVAMSPAFLKKIEKDKTALSVDVLLQIAGAFGKQVKLV